MHNGLQWDYDTFNQCVRRRLKVIGSGCFGTVYALDEKRVVKVSSVVSDGWLVWIKWAMTVGRVKYPQFVPKVYAIKEFNINRGRVRPFAVAIMERLDSNPRPRRLDISEENRMIRLCNALTWYGGNENWRDAGPGHRMDYVQAVYDTPGATELMDDLYALGRIVDACMDLHGGNIMFRNGCQPVVTDPFAGTDSRAQWSQRKKLLGSDPADIVYSLQTGPNDEEAYDAVFSFHGLTFNSRAAA